jgi:hypothetical protein
MVTTTMCYTTTCWQSVGCSIQPSTTTSITTSEAEACTLIQGQPYDAIATFKEAGLPLLGWMQYPVTDDPLPDPGDDDSGDDDDDDSDDQDDDPEEATSGSTSSQTTGRLERTESSLMLPSGDASQPSSRVDDSCTTTMEAEPCNSSDDATACKFKRDTVSMKTVCGLDVPRKGLTATPTSDPTSTSQAPLVTTPTTTIGPPITPHFEPPCTLHDSRCDLETTCSGLHCNGNDPRPPHRSVMAPVCPERSVSGLDIPTASITPTATHAAGAHLEKSVAALDVPTGPIRGWPSRRVRRLLPHPRLRTT